MKLFDATHIGFVENRVLYPLFIQF
jgi:hypothetical protein